MASDSPLRLGVIGAGWFASRRHCPDIIEHPEAVLTALCRRSKPALERMGQAFGVNALFTDYRELLSSGQVDAVVVCSPHDLHYEHTKAALETGCPVLLEKPLTVDPQQGRELVELARARGLALLVAQNPPYWNHCHHLRAAISAGRIGDMETIAIAWVGNALGVLGREPLPENLPGIVPPTLFRQDSDSQGGFFADGGSHLLTELLWCTDRTVVQVTSLMDDPGPDVRAALALRLDNGALATLSNTADSHVPGKRHHSLYLGSKGSAEIRGVPFSVTVDDGTTRDAHSEADLPAVPTPVQDFISAVRHQTTLRIDAEMGLHVVEILDAAYRSARTGSAICLT